MYTPTPDEKTTLVVAYTQNAFIRGEAVTKQSTRVSTWLRSPGMPEYIHLLKPQTLVLSAGTVKVLNYPEMYVATSMVIGFHIMPPATDPMDYEADEKNRAMIPVTAMIGSFLFKGQIRVSAQTGIAASIESARTAWMSIYDSEVTNPALPQMPVMHVPLALFNPKQVAFAVD